MQSIQTALETKLAQLDGEIMTIDQMSQTVVSRRPESKVPGKPDERYMVHTYSTNPESYGSLFWGCYDLSPAQAMESLIEKIQKETKTGRQDTDENYLPLGDDLVIFKPAEFYATPDTMQDMTNYLTNFSGGESIAAYTCAYMMYNWCAKMSNPETRGEI